MLLTIGIWVGVGLLAFVGTMKILHDTVQGIYIKHHVEKLLRNTPVMKWMTIEDTGSLGGPTWLRIKFFTKLYERNLLEVRLRSNVSEIILSSFLEEEGFSATTIALHEFRRTKYLFKKRLFSNTVGTPT